MQLMQPLLLLLLLLTQMRIVWLHQCQMTLQLPAVLQIMRSQQLMLVQHNQLQRQQQRTRIASAPSTLRCH
jgi:hypothetical protein